MSTKAPAGITLHPADSLESVSYSVVSDIVTDEPNDRNRLGYQVWTWLRERNGSLDQAVRAAGTRTAMSLPDMVRLIARRLEEKGIKVS